MRIRLMLSLGVLTAALATGCGKATDQPGVATAATGATPSSGPSATATRDPDAPLKFAQCMREQGMTWFPDPDARGRSMVRVPASVKKEDFDAAQQACRQWAPFGGEAPKLSPEELERARQMAKCMRENGVPNFPDPRPDGSIMVDGSKLGVGPGDPSFDAAEKACAQYLPQGPRTTEENSSGGETA